MKIKNTQTFGMSLFIESKSISKMSNKAIVMLDEFTRSPEIEKVTEGTKVFVSNASSLLKEKILLSAMPEEFGNNEIFHYFDNLRNGINNTQKILNIKSLTAAKFKDAVEEISIIAKKIYGK